MIVRTGLVALAAAVVAAHAPAAVTKANWNLGQQRQVAKAGIMAPLRPGRFDGGQALGVGAMRAALAAYAARETPAVAPVAVEAADGPLTVARFDALLVEQLGLARVAAHVENVAKADGLLPPSYFGTEVVARFIGLRDAHPLSEAAIDLDPTDPITRAEAAHSFAVLLEQGGGAASAARGGLRAFALPRYGAAQREVLRIAVSKIGMPYVWGGTTDNTADGLAHGGYDCSGFVWRVYKLSGLPWGRAILGRTAAQQAAEIPVSQRIRMRDVAPGDLLFFGSARFHARVTPTNVIHEAIALGDGWVINSSGQGVYVEPLTSGWLHQSFAWARRVL